jgi:hypothetical protein
MERFNKHMINIDRNYLVIDIPETIPHVIEEPLIKEDFK